MSESGQQVVWLELSDTSTARATDERTGDRAPLVSKLVCSVEAERTARRPVVFDASIVCRCPV